MKKLFIPVLISALLLSACSSGNGTNSGTNGGTDTAYESVIDTSNRADVTTDSGDDNGDGGDEVDENTCTRPKLLVHKNISSDTVMAAGTCDEGCTLRIEIDGKEEKTVFPDGENYVFSVTVPKRKTVTVSVTAVKDGKNDSKKAEFTAKYDARAEDLGIYVTNDSRLLQSAVLNDVFHDRLLTKNKLNAIHYAVADRVEQTRAVTGKDTKFIYLIVPHSTDVYTDGVEVESRKETRITQVKQTLSDIDGVVVIDAGEILKQNLDKGKLYYCLDTHWTELGAYFGYYAIMDEISKSFSSAKPHELDEYDINDVTLTYTDMIYYAQTQGSGMKETAPFLRPKYTPLTQYDNAKPEEADIWTYVRKFFEKTAVSEVDNEALPTAQLIMDSYGLNCVAYLAEHFSTLSCNPVWNYSLDLETTQSLKPDYVIQILNIRTVEKLAS